jgi:hypothetical protein
VQVKTLALYSSRSCETDHRGWKCWRGWEREGVSQWCRLSKECMWGRRPHQNARSGVTTADEKTLNPFTNSGQSVSNSGSLYRCMPLCWISGFHRHSIQRCGDDWCCTIRSPCPAVDHAHVCRRQRSSPLSWSTADPMPSAHTASLLSGFELLNYTHATYE